MDHRGTQLFNLVVKDVYGEWLEAERGKDAVPIVDRPLHAEWQGGDGKVITIAAAIDATKKKHATLKNTEGKPITSDAEAACGLQANMFQPEMVNGRMQAYLYDVISPFWGANVADLIEVFSAAGEAGTDIHVNSPGGSVPEGRAMQNAIMRQRQHGEVVVHVDGIAASAATTAALGANRTIFNRGSQYMIHNSHGLFATNRHGAQKAIDLMLKVDTQMAEDYAEVTGKTVQEMMAYMDAETFFSAQEAADMGFCKGLQPKSFEGGQGGSPSLANVVELKPVGDPMRHAQMQALLNV